MALLYTASVLVAFAGNFWLLNFDSAVPTVLVVCFVKLCCILSSSTCLFPHIESAYLACFSLFKLYSRYHILLYQLFTSDVFLFPHPMDSPLPSCHMDLHDNNPSLNILQFICQRSLKCNFLSNWSSPIICQRLGHPGCSLYVWVTFPMQGIPTYIIYEVWKHKCIIIAIVNARNWHLMWLLLIARSVTICPSFYLDQ